MKSFSSLAMVTLCSLSLFASARVASAQPDTSGRTYSPAQITVVMTMREFGDSLADVAKVVGGSRADVKAAEAAEKARRKSHDNRRVSATVVAPARTYSPALRAVMREMREFGASLAEVAQVVGGSRADVKAAEMAEKASTPGPQRRDALQTSVWASR